MAYNLKKAISQYNNTLTKEPYTIAGELGVTKNGSQLVEVPTRNAFVYVRVRGSTSELIEAFNDKVAPVYGLPVLIVREGNRYVIKGRDTQRYGDWGGFSSYLPRHAQTHEFTAGGGGDIVWVESEQFTPAMVFPSGTNGASSLNVAPYVLQRNNDFILIGNTGTGNLVQYKPTNNQAIMGLVYLDTVSGNPGFLLASGTPFAASITGTSQILPYLPYPSSTQQPLYGVRLVSGTTSLNWDNIYDVRQFIGGGGNNTGSSSGLVAHTHSSPTDGGTTLQVDIDTYRFGFVTDYAGNPQVTGSFDGTNTFTLTPLNTTWDYYRNGIKYTITGAKSVTLSGSPPAAKNRYFIYIDSTNGSLTCDTTGWNLEDTKVPVASICWDNTLTPKYWIANERHTVAIDRRYHFEHHNTEGTQPSTLPILSGYTVAPAIPTNANNTFSISQGVIIDEDLKHILSALTNPTGTSLAYEDFFRVTGSNSWNWETSDMPYRYTTGSYIQYDLNGTMTTGQGNKFYNTYLLLTNYSGAARFSFIHGQSEFSTVALAQAEAFNLLVKTGLPIDEYVAVYQFTWETSAGYTTKGKSRLAVAPKSIEISASGLGGAGSIAHNSTTGLQGGTTNEYYHQTAADRGFTSTATTGGTTTLTAASNNIQEFTGTSSQTIQLPDVSTLSLGRTFKIINRSTQTLTVTSSGNNGIGYIRLDQAANLVCSMVTGTGVSSWDMELELDWSSASELTGGGTTTLHKHVSILPWGGYINSVPVTVTESYPYSAAIGKNITITSLKISVLVITTNNASNYWTIGLKNWSAPGTAIVELNTSGVTVNVRSQLSTTTFGSYNFTASDLGFYIQCDKVGSPGPMYILLPFLEYY